MKVIEQEQEGELKVSVTWGDGPDMLLVNEGEHYILHDDPTLKDRWKHGVSFQGSFDLSVAKAKRLVGDLKIAIAHVEELEIMAKDYFEEEERNRR